MEKSSIEHVAAEIDPKTKSNYEAVGLYMEPDYILAEENTRLVADNRDEEHAVIQVMQVAVQEGKYPLYDIWVMRSSVLLDIVS